MRNLFETGKITEATIGDYMVKMNKNKCFEVRNKLTGFMELESSSIQTYESIRDYCLKFSKWEKGTDGGRVVYLNFVWIAGQYEAGKHLSI